MTNEMLQEVFDERSKEKERYNYFFAPLFAFRGCLPKSLIMQSLLNVMLDHCDCQ